MNCAISHVKGMNRKKRRTTCRHPYRCMQSFLVVLPLPTLTQTYTFKSNLTWNTHAEALGHLGVNEPASIWVVIYLRGRQHFGYRR